MSQPPSPRVQQRIEDLIWMWETGERYIPNIAKRSGLSEDTVKEYLRRGGVNWKSAA